MIKTFLNCKIEVAPERSKRADDTVGQHDDDGCYVLKTDLSQTAASKDIVHDRYKDLAIVEYPLSERNTSSR